MNSSKYNSTINSKITYLLGAGASYNAVPIWNRQAESMIGVSGEMTKLLRDSQIEFSTNKETRDQYDFLTNLFKELEFFGIKALEFGSIDIYAKRLYLLKEYKDLNSLKKCVSIYFDLWESGFLECSNNKKNEDDRVYKKIDQRYLSLLSVLLESRENIPCLNSNVSFLSWNYDLQLEKSFENFLPKKEESLIALLEKIADNSVIHLNGYRGILKNGKEIHETVDKTKFTSLKSYLVELGKKGLELERTEDSFLSTIKYAWEMDAESKEKAKSILKETNVLVIIGYSFPAFNRVIDQELIKEFEKGTDHKRVIYQDPNANTDIINSLFANPKNVQLEKENTEQFYIPHEFLSPSEGEFFVI